MGKIVPASFYRRDALLVARGLLGKFLVKEGDLSLPVIRPDAKER